MGYCGDVNIGDFVVNVMPYPQKIRDTKAYMYYILPKHIKKALISQGYGKNTDLIIPGKENAGVEIIVAINNELYSINIGNDEPLQGIIQVSPIGIPYCTGDGGHAAWASLLTTEDLSIKSKDRVRIAIEVSSRFIPSVDNKIDIRAED